MKSSPNYQRGSQSQLKPDPASPLIRGLVGLAVVCAIAPLLIFLWLLPTLPDYVPMHWNFAGEVDSYAPPVMMVWLPVLLLLLAVGLLVIVRWPQATNTPWEPVTEAGWQEYYVVNRLFVVFMSFCVTALNFVMTYSVVGLLSIQWCWAVLGVALIGIAVLIWRTYVIAHRLT
ncbi:MAG: DUF1648 domain-containing protein [Arcanobacterium sp.]|nr:DUF1648 domain-containing protein [Arcanobacterium sp.]